ncbi:MAG: HDOD domain-containing protein [Hydrogenophilales bacterium CG03_land_8_20_14_0_80_62_28]|nr:HDOD domain-containing protein [Betaproteobacteria bacterium]OIO77511.1 MAG: hypothetical protein AUJ86_08595 [Hydrogenophilaceae bacterium CG1_02_62_390]PIV22926.1 MAG: HDOD domain-containing protein [Hydrogenophilales bacterium CG03_land_8_20_14_0_80_62_28]PIW38022.1 MAG: HDOD domain-containing protein [Hydrogenophilales bacterium CG15_BIG_FIL_POST_REV_8_21_14_020_62_31]PIW72301.1 MAG: HDOD domain-containing protein [Hydrogenophilales bacterium CG12_big_fil_rev_8_21_14_0_65_61_21]PIX00593
MTTAQKMVAGVEQLASLPAVYSQVRSVLDNPDSSVNDLANVVAADAGLTVRLLHVVNSVYFGLMSRVDTVSRAVGVLGMQQVHDIVLATSVSAMFKGMSPASMNMTRFWSDSVLRALIARTGAEMVRAGDLERFFVSGLLADLGHLVMYQVEPKLAEQAQRQSELEAMPLAEAERALLGCDYAQVGAALTAKWNLPPRLCAAIGAQIQPASAPEAFQPDAGLLNLARIMVDGMARKLENNAIAPLVADHVWQLTGLKPANVSTIRLLAEMNHSEVVGLFFPQIDQGG